MLSFIEKATQKFGGKFDYSLVHYSTAKEKVKIICPEHGEFLQTPDKHLNSKFGCLKCSLLYKDKVPYEKSTGYRKLGKTKYSKELCIKNLLNKYRNFFSYDFSKFIDGLDGIIIVNCKKHGVFEKTYRNLMAARCVHGCDQCHWEHFKSIRTKDWSNFVECAGVIHNNKYIYIDSKYINRKSIVNIVCPKHGVFKKIAQKHLSGQGCIQCMYDRLIESEVLKGGYNEAYFLTNPQDINIPAILYYIKINDKYYKIGVTIKSAKDRINGLKTKSNGYIKNTEILFEHRDTLYNCYQLEQEILSEFSFIRSPRRWSTELFSDNILNYEQFNKFSFFVKRSYENSQYLPFE